MIFYIMRILIFSAVLFFISCSVSKDPRREHFRDLQKGDLKDDTSFVYSLPYEKGKSFFMLQGYFSRLTHKNRAALDFKMKRGTKIVAARGGVVIRIKEDGDKGRLRPQYRQYGNLVVIEHEDGSRASYWHLLQNGALVNVGDTVQIGQVIALSGKTGYTALPHIHFFVWKTSINSQWQQVGTRFQTKKGPRYLRPFRFYRNPVK
jgi:murein DD-endopeptidase MepM/ murein hydrolase activator NlpD